MYIDKAIIEELTDEFDSPVAHKILHTVIDNTSWLSFEDVKQEWNAPNTLLEEVFDKYYFIVEENKILFCPPDWFWSSVQEIEQEL